MLMFCLICMMALGVSRPGFAQWKAGGIDFSGSYDVYWQTDTLHAANNNLYVQFLLKNRQHENDVILDGYMNRKTIYLTLKKIYDNKGNLLATRSISEHHDIDSCTISQACYLSRWYAKEKGLKFADDPDWK